MTLYVVLKRNEVSNAAGEEFWHPLGEQEGANDLAAIKAFLENSDGKFGAGIYRGVPKRSWPDKPHDLKSKISFV